MAAMSDTLLLWSPRILGILVCLFVGMFALDAFAGGKSTAAALLDFLIHVAPALILLGIVAFSWRRPWLGGFVFILLAAGYAYMARNHLSWIALISGPLLLVGILFLWSWAHQRTLGPSA